MADDKGIVTTTLDNESDSVNGMFTSLTRFGDVIPLRIGLERTAFTAVDRSLDNRDVVIKTCLCFDDLSSQQMLDHASSLRKLVHQNIAAVYDVFTIGDRSETIEGFELKRVCIVQELLDLDLQSLISSGQVMSSYCHRFSYQLFAALKYAHSVGIGHFGLKPSNILVCFQDLTLKVSDFGISRVMDQHASSSRDHHLKELPSAVSKLWYQAPELLLRATNVTTLTDVWSAGCIMAELLSGRPLFTGTSDMDQLLKYIDAIHLSDDDWTRVLHVMPNKLLKNHPFKPRSPLRSQLKISNRQAIHLLESLLSFNPNERLTADEALSHTYFAGIRPTVGNSMQPHDWTRNEANRDPDRCSNQVVEGVGSVSTNHRQPIRDETDDIALRNYLNNQSCTGSPTSNAGDRTPSPNIFDLLELRLPKGGISKEANKAVLEASDSDGEKEVAEISDEKLREDLEIGNLSVELLRRLQCQRVSCDIGLPDILTALHLDTGISNSLDSQAPVHGSQIRTETLNHLVVNNLSAEGDDVARTTRDFLDFVAKHPDIDRLLCRPLPDLDMDEEKQKRPTSIEDFDDYLKSTDKSSSAFCNEDSNKRDKGSIGDAATDMKSNGRSSGVASAACAGEGTNVVGSVSRKLILDKIESEKARTRRRRSGVGAQSPTSRRFDAALTSEEFDELYRLPTEHLRKDKQQAHTAVERNSRSGIADRHQYRHHRHHSHDSFHASGGRHAYTDDDRSHRDAEGACGGSDYYCYDDMAMTHCSGIEYDMDYMTPMAMNSTVRQNDCHGAAVSLRNDDWIEFSVADVPLPRGSSMSFVGRDATSSPESPTSSPAVQAGARPKKSPRNRRAQ